MGFESVLAPLLSLGVIVFAYVLGRAAEKRHFASIRQREHRFLHQPALSARTWDTSRTVIDSRLVCGSVVVSVDHFKRLIAGFRLLVGGELRAYSPLIDRGRREAILRMKEELPAAHAFVNLRLETSTISNGQGRAVGTVEVLAYATAITYAEPSPQPILVT